MNERRTITSDDFEKIVAATSDVLPEAEQDEFRFFLRGFWEAGIPFGWVLQLMWDEGHVNAQHGQAGQAGTAHCTRLHAVKAGAGFTV